MSEEDAIRLFEALMDCLDGREEGPAQAMAQGVIELLLMAPTNELDSLRCEIPGPLLAGWVPQWEAQPAGPWPG